MKKYVFINDKTKIKLQKNSQQVQCNNNANDQSAKKNGIMQKQRAINKYKSEMQKHLNFN